MSHSISTLLTRNLSDVFGENDPVGATVAVLSVAVAAAKFGMTMPWCLVVLMLAPAVSVVGYELVGYGRATDP